MAEFKKLLFGKVVKDVTRNYSKIPKTDYLAEGLYPIIDQGKDFICGYTNDPQKVTTKDKPVIIFGDHTRIFKLIDFPIAIGADGVKVLEVDSSIADEEFVYEYLRTINLHNAGYSRHFKYLKEVQIPVPDSIDAQKRIATVLQKTESLIIQRNESLQLADELLNHTFLTMFGDCLKITSSKSFQPLGNVISYLSDYHSNGSYKTLKENVQLLNRPDYALMIRTTDLENKEYVDGCNYIDERTYNYLEKSKIYGNEVIINKIGSAGKVYLMPNLNRPVSLGMNAFLLRFKPSVSSIFIYFLLQTKRYEKEIQKRVKGAVTKTITKDAVRSIPINVPSLELQDKFKDIVDQIGLIKSYYEKSLNELNELYHSLSHKAFNGDLTIIEKIKIEGTIKIEPKISANVEVIEQKQPIETIPEPGKNKEEVSTSITHIPFLKTEEDLLSHISRNCSGSHFTFEDIKEAVKGLDWTYDFEELKNLVFSLVRNKQLKQVFADASYKSGFIKADAAFKEITDLSEQIYFKRML